MDMQIAITWFFDRFHNTSDASSKTFRRVFCICNFLQHILQCLNLQQSLLEEI